MAEKGHQITFWSKNPLKCPVCKAEFRKEELMRGGGRLNAGQMEDDLRRSYIPSQKYGEIFPLIYYMTVCPECLYAAGSDFFDVAGKDKITGPLAERKEERKEALSRIFPGLDFSRTRTLESGAASYYYGMMCLELFPKFMSPTIKQGIYSLRAGWICRDLHKKHPADNYDYLASIFFRKAQFLYNSAIEKEQTGAESLGGVSNYGPDLDKNYGYNGILYVAAYLSYKYGTTLDPDVRMRQLDIAKKTVAKLFGMGKISKDKPDALLDNARKLHEKMQEEYKKLKGE